MNEKQKIEKEQMTIRLTVRTSEELNNLIRNEAVRRGTNVNQTMLHILTLYFQNYKE